MKLAIHQPNFLPWSGYFHKMASADIFLLLDTVQYVKSEYDNRCKIKTADGEQWLTVPVSTPKINTLSRDVKISNNVDWKKLHKKTITYNYSKSPYFEKYESMLTDTYNANSESLLELNIVLIYNIKKLLGIETRLILTSELPENNLKGTELLLYYCEEFNADSYLSGSGGKQYLNEELFMEKKMGLEYQNYVPIKYPQLFGDFIENLSIIDLIFNCGEESLSRIMGEH